MGPVYQISKFDELVQPSLNQNLTLLEFTTKRLTAAGENYGSMMLAVDLKLYNKKLQKEEILHLVAKMCPPTALLKEIFSVSVTFKKEIYVYTEIFPAMRALQKEKGVSELADFIPECYGARVNINPYSDAVDDDAVLLLENLKLQGYELVDRMKGFDLATTEMILKDLAMFHAIPIAIKLLKPDVFREKILRHLSRNDVFDTFPQEAIQAIIDLTLETSKFHPECLPFINKIEKAINLGFDTITRKSIPREPFATITHNDYWVNNTMIKFENNKPVKNKMVDFQVIDYGSPGKDVVFFLFSSVQDEVLDKYYDHLLKLYYNTFIGTLQNLKCNTSPFTFKLFKEEINVSAKTTEFFHVVLMLKPILAIRGTVKELSEITEKDLFSNGSISEELKKKLPKIVTAFGRRQWI